MSQNFSLSESSRLTPCTIFPIISQWGLSVAMDTRVLIQSASKTLCSLSPPPVMLHTKFDQDWPTGLRNIKVLKCKVFVIQGQVTPKWVHVVWSGPKSTSSSFLCPSYQQLWWWLDQKWKASMETPFSHYKSMGNVLDAQGQLTR